MTHYSPSAGYMTETIQRGYIAYAITQNMLPAQAHRMPQILSLVAAEDRSKPIQFWQLFSVMGQKRILRIVHDFYHRVYEDEAWFRDVFARVGDAAHHVRTQSAMWIDVMGGGFHYHGAEFRLNFHHQHNAFQLMTKEGAARWTKLMIETLQACDAQINHDPRIRPSINTFLQYFMSKYAAEFGFQTSHLFGPTNPAVRRKINFMNMTDAAIEALSDADLKEGLSARGVDLSSSQERQALIKKAQSL